MPVRAEEIYADDSFACVEVVDNSTNEIVEIKMVNETLTPVMCASTATDTQRNAEYDVTFLFPIDGGIKTQSSVSSEQEEVSIHAKIKLTYNLSSGYEEIKISNVSGFWECTSSQYSMTFSNRTVAVNDGRLAGKTIIEYPSQNTFSYDTGWGYVQYYPGSTDAMTGPRAYSEATGSIVGMGGSYTLYISVNVTQR